MFLLPRHPFARSQLLHPPPLSPFPWRFVHAFLETFGAVKAKGFAGKRGARNTSQRTTYHIISSLSFLMMFLKSWGGSRQRHVGVFPNACSRDDDR